MIKFNNVFKQNYEGSEIMKKQIIKVTGCPEAIGPYSQAAKLMTLFIWKSPYDVETGKMLMEELKNKPI